MTEQPTLHPRTSELVDRFAAALKEKLAAAEKKYGYSDAWAKPDWMNECRHKLLEHIAKGDARDVAAYCAFLWHHGEETAEAAAAPETAPRASLMRERTEGYVYARQQAADFVRSAGHPDLAASILLNWAPEFLPPACASCEGSGDREVFVQSGGSMPWNAGDGHNETGSCPDCKGEGLDYAAAPVARHEAQSWQAHSQLSVSAGTARTDGARPDGQGEQA